jgi:hypothetical protein
MRKYIIIADAHLGSGVEEDSAYLLVRKVIKTGKFDGLINIGDHLDFGYISRYVDGQPGLVEGKRLKDDFELLRSEIKFHKKYCKEVIYLCGNHENRVEKYLLGDPRLEGIFSVKDICEEEGAIYVPVEKQPYRFLPDLYVTHGLSFNKYFAAQIAERAGTNIIQGHAHRTQMFSYQYPTGERATGYGLGTLGPINPSYSAGQRLTGHTQSFGVLYVDGNTWQLDIIYITNNSCMIAGKKYSLINEE